MVCVGVEPTGSTVVLESEGKLEIQMTPRFLAYGSRWMMVPLMKKRILDVCSLNTIIFRVNLRWNDR